MRGGQRSMGVRVRRLSMAAALAFPGAVVIYTGFRAGGYFAGTQAMLIVVLATVLALWILFAPDPIVGGSPTLVVAGSGLAVFAVVALLSAGWSDSPSRAVIEFDRALLYLLALVLFGLLPMTRDGLRWMLRGLFAGLVAVCAVAFLSRTLPDLVSGGSLVGRLSYPVGYSNTLGLLGAVGIILALHLTCTERERRWTRVLASAAIPLLCTTVYLTFSRGAIAAGALGVVLYFALSRPRLVLTGLLPVVPAAAIALRAAAAAPALASKDPVFSIALAQGRHLASVVAVCTIAAAAVRALLVPLDGRIARRRKPWVPRSAAIGIAAGAVVLASIGFFAAGVPAALERQYDEFVNRPFVQPSPDLRTRIVDPSGSGRAHFWRLSLETFRLEPLHGHGAGTYQLLWHRYASYPSQLYDGHSLYLESLAELGLIGFVPLGVALIALMAGMARRIRGLDRSLFAAMFAATLTWAVHAGMEWDWEMPVATLWVFACGGAVLATPLRLRSEQDRVPLRVREGLPRLAPAAACLLLAVLPIRVALSQESLNRAVRAFRDNDCVRTRDEAVRSIRALNLRPEPFELYAYCEVRRGRPLAAIASVGEATRLDPRNWQYWYALALVRAAGGRDPRAAVRRAHELNPREPLANRALGAFRTGGPAEWRREALRLRLPPT